MNTLVILNDPPYGTERSYNGLRLAGPLVHGAVRAHCTHQPGAARP